MDTIGAPYNGTSQWAESPLYQLAEAGDLESGPLQLPQYLLLLHLLRLLELSRLKDAMHTCALPLKELKSSSRGSHLCSAIR